jgi:hypothetical protein
MSNQNKVEVSREMSVEDTAKILWYGKMPKTQYQANLLWLKEIYQLIKVGGLWTYSNAGLVFIKTKNGFRLQLR